MTDALIDQFTVAGSADDCHASLRRFAAAGLDAPAFLVPHDLDFDQQVTAIADELLPFWAELRKERAARP